MTTRGRSRGPARWLDAGSFALGVLTEALVELRRERPVARAAPVGPAATPTTVPIESARRRPRIPRRRPSAPRARRSRP